MDWKKTGCLVLLGVLAPLRASIADELTPEKAMGGGEILFPKVAKEVKEQEFRKMLAGKQISLTNSAEIQRQKQLAIRALEGDKAFVNKMLANQPELLKRLTRKPSPDLDVKPTDDGNYRITIRNTKGDKQDIITMGEEFLYGEVASALRQFPSQGNQALVYTNLYRGLPQRYIQAKQLPQPEQIFQLPAERLLAINTKIASDLSEIIKYIPIDPKPAGYPGSCANEIGYDSRDTDQTGSACAHDPSSIFARIAYPLKWFATCVKNQGNRGTCVSFGVTASVEAKIAVQHAKWVNLSEESLYNAAKMTWYPSTFGDGLNTAGIVDDIKNRAYVFPYENSWNYNPSYDRTEDDVHMTYHNSCVGYNGIHCSDTNHQGQLVCSKIPLGGRILSFCGYTAPVPGSSGYKATAISQMWNPANTGLSTALVAIASLIKNPVTIALPVTPSFDGAPANGVASYVGSSEGNRGWHAVAVMGYVSNERLPAGLAKGAGGGYFIVKNSWGSCWKDAGYIYLPYAWVQAYVGSASNISSVN